MSSFAYLFKRFPVFAQTFVAREVEGMARQGCHPPVFSLQPPEDAAKQEGFAALEKRVCVVPAKARLAVGILAAGLTGKIPAKAFFGGGWSGAAGRHLREALWLGPRLRAAGVRHVHTHFVGHAARTAWHLKNAMGFTYSITAHANDFLSDAQSIPNLKTLVEDAAFVVAVSDYSRKWFEERFPACRIVRIYNGMALDGFPAPAPVDPPLIVSVGRLVEKKGFSVLLEACRLLRETGREFRCRIIGGGPLQASLKAQRKSANLVEIVDLAGARSQPEIRDALSKATLFALPCVEEKDGGMDILPTVITEAMAARLPVVSTTLAGVPEMIRDGVTGFLCPPGDAPALATAIGRLLDQPELAVQMGAAGLRHAGEHFSEDVTLPQLRRLLEDPASVRTRLPDTPPAHG